jgi:gliding motility-associated-like protein
MPCVGLKNFTNCFTAFCMAMLFALPLFAQPSINSFSPLSAAVGSTVTIAGSNFSPTMAGNIVYFGNIKAAVTSASATMLTVTVPAGATHNFISVTANYFTGYSTMPFTVISGAALTPSSFSTRIPFAVTGSNPSSIAVGDLDGDGKPDLVCTNFNSNNISVFKNSSISGTVQMQAETKWPTGNLPEGLAMGDLNSDGKPDLVITSINDHLISVYMNISAVGTIAFASRIDISAGATSWPRGVAIHDIDGDSKPDLIVADNNKIYNLNSTSNGTVSIYRNISVAGAVGFSPAVSFPTGDYSRKVFIGDINGDGKPDVAVTNNGAGSVSVLQNNSAPGSITFVNIQNYLTGGNPEMVAIGDLTGDGKPDMVVSNLTSSTLSMFKNTSVSGNISFASKQDFALSDPLGVAIGDVTGDGIPDLVAASFASGQVSVFKNTTAGNALSFAPKMDYASGSSPVQVAIGDIDGDDMPDISLTNSSINFVSVLKMAPVLSVNLGNDTSLCAGDSLKLRVNVPGDQYLWSTGDVQNNVTIKQSGRYWVRVTTGAKTVSDTIQVTFKPLPVVDLGSDTILCEGKIIILKPAVTGADYLWQNGSRAESMTVAQSGDYWLQLTQNGCAASDTIKVSYRPMPLVDLGNDTAICQGSTLMLDAFQPNATYLWSNGDAADAINVQDQGVYWVAVTVDGCEATDSIQISYLILPRFPLGNDTTLCEDQTLILKPDAGNVSFLWQDGSTGSTFSVKQPGTYKVTLSNQCETVSDEIMVQRGLCELYMPNAFTPNHDGINDVFRVKYPAFIKTFYMQIFNRWGQLVYRSDNPYKGWDGIFNGTQQSAGNYVWTVLLTDVNGNSKRYKGTVLLIQ